MSRGDTWLAVVDDGGGDAILFAVEILSGVVADTPGVDEMAPDEVGVFDVEERAGGGTGGGRSGDRGEAGALTCDGENEASLDDVLPLLDTRVLLATGGGLGGGDGEEGGGECEGGGGGGRVSSTAGAGGGGEGRGGEAGDEDDE